MLLLSDHARTAEEVLPALRLLPYDVHVRRAEAGAETSGVVIVDARKDLHAARALCQELRDTQALIAVFTDGGLVTVDPGWGVDDILLDTSPPAEVAARLRWAGRRRPPGTTPEPCGLSFDDTARTVRMDGRAVTLTFAEYQILSRLAARPGQVYTHRQLLAAYGSHHPDSVRSVYTHVRRLRAKLGPALIHTTHGIGYRLDPEQQGVTRSA
ncbi:response regulator transcription factor [Spirillospora sp. NPDC047279]|uniref:winged helix-turn-helix transcriptional regulator n=1 Tax=Spirillospora sp. NPDC047279 TaxID=3155478 RepID=UPI0033D36693